MSAKAPRRTSKRTRLFLPDGSPIFWPCSGSLATPGCYSTRREEYVREIRAVIRSNDLTRFDQAHLTTAPGGDFSTQLL